MIIITRHSQHSFQALNFVDPKLVSSQDDHLSKMNKDNLAVIIPKTNNKLIHLLCRLGLSWLLHACIPQVVVWPTQILRQRYDRRQLEVNTKAAITDFWVP